MLRLKLRLISKWRRFHPPLIQSCYIGLQFETLPFYVATGSFCLKEFSALDIYIPIHIGIHISYLCICIPRWMSLYHCSQVPIAQKVSKTSLVYILSEARFLSFSEHSLSFCIKSSIISHISHVITLHKTFAYVEDMLI
jgi:hypothetical protein